MTREEAKEILIPFQKCMFDQHGCPISDVAIALDVAITALEQPEIIRCKDCKWYGRADKRRFYRGADCLNKRIDTIVPNRDFCSRAERREE